MAHLHVLNFFLCLDLSIVIMTTGDILNFYSSLQIQLSFQAQGRPLPSLRRQIRKGVSFGICNFLTLGGTASLLYACVHLRGFTHYWAVASYCA